MMFGISSRNHDYIHVDEDEVIKFFVGLGIPKDDILIDFDTHERAFHSQAGMMIVYLGIPFKEETEIDLQEKLDDVWGDDNDVYDYEITSTYDDNLMVVNVYFSAPIYNPNEEAWR